MIILSSLNRVNDDNISNSIRFARLNVSKTSCCSKNTHDLKY